MPTVLDAYTSFREDTQSVLKLRELLGSPWFGAAVHAALLEHNKSAGTVDEIHGARGFVEKLSALAAPEPPKRPRIESGINHDTDYAKRNRARKAKGSSQPDAAA